MVHHARIDQHVFDVTIHTDKKTFDMQLPGDIPMQRLIPEIIKMIPETDEQETPSAVRDESVSANYTFSTINGEKVSIDQILKTYATTDRATHLYFTTETNKQKPEPVIEEIGDSVAYTQHRLNNIEYDGIVTTIKNVAAIIIPIIWTALVIVPPTAALNNLYARSGISIVSFMFIAFASGCAKKNIINNKQLATTIAGGVLVTCTAILAEFSAVGISTYVGISAAGLFIASAATAILTRAYRPWLVAFAAAALPVCVVVLAVPHVTSIYDSRIAYILMVVMLVALVNTEPIAAVLTGIKAPNYPSRTNSYIADIIAAATPPDFTMLRPKTLHAASVTTGLIIACAVIHAFTCFSVIKVNKDGLGPIILSASLALIYITRSFNYTLNAHVTALLYSAAGIYVVSTAALMLNKMLLEVCVMSSAMLCILLFGIKTVPTTNREKTPLVRQLRTFIDNILIVFALTYPFLLLKIPQAIYNRSW